MPMRPQAKARQMPSTMSADSFARLNPPMDDDEEIFDPFGLPDGEAMDAQALSFTASFGAPQRQLRHLTLVHGGAGTPFAQGPYEQRAHARAREERTAHEFEQQQQQRRRRAS